MDPKKAKTSRRKYDADFKKEVVKMIESGRPVPEVAQSMGIGTNLIYYWLKRAKKGPSKPHAKAELTFDQEKASLQKRLKEVEMERDILKKALGIFSRPM